MSVSTSPGSELDVVSYEVREQHGYFPDSGPLGGVNLGETVHRRKGILVWACAEKGRARIMRLTRDNDFSGATTEIGLDQIVAMEPGEILPDHSLYLPYSAE